MATAQDRQRRARRLRLKLKLANQQEQPEAPAPAENQDALQFGGNLPEPDVAPTLTELGARKTEVERPSAEAQLTRPPFDPLSPTGIPPGRQLEPQQNFTPAQLTAQRLGAAGLIGLGGATATATGGLVGEGLLGTRLGASLARVVGEAVGSFGFEGARQAFLNALDLAQGKEARGVDPVGFGLAAAAPVAGGVVSGGSRAAGLPAQIPGIMTENVAFSTRTPLDLLRPGRGARLTFGSQAPRTVPQLLKGVSAETIKFTEPLKRVIPQIAKKIRPERIQKQALLSQLDDAGVIIPGDDVIAALESSKIGVEGAVGSLNPQFTNYNNALDFAIKELKRSMGPSAAQLDDEIAKRLAAGGRFRGMGVEKRAAFQRLKAKGFREGLKATDADRVITEQLRQKAFGSTGLPAHNLIGESFGKANTAMQEALVTAADVAGLGSIAEKNIAIAESLALRDRAQRVFGSGLAQEAGPRENTIRLLFEPGNTENIKLLNFIGQESNDPGLVKRILDLRTERAFTRDPRTTGQGGGFQTFFGTAARGAIKTAAPFQSLAAPTAAFATQFEQSRRGSRPPSVDDLPSP